MFLLDFFENIRIINNTLVEFDQALFNLNSSCVAKRGLGTGLDNNYIEGLPQYSRLRRALSSSPA